MKERYLENKLFLKYLASYLVVLLIPLAVFTMFISQSLMNVMRKQFVTENVQSLYQFETGIDNAVSRMEAVRDSLIDTVDLDVPPELSDVVKAKELIRSLKTFAVSNSVISDIAFYLYGDSYLYTSNSSYLLDNFFSKEYYYQDWTAEEFLKMLPELKTRTVRPEEWMELNGEYGKLITVMYPVEKHGKKGVLMFMLHAEKMFPENRNAAFFIRDDQGRMLLASYPPEFPKEQWDAQDWIRVLEEHEKPFVYEEGLVSATVSDFTNWEYIKVSPISEVDEAMSAIQQSFLVIEALIVMVGAVLIWFNMRMSYSPLRILGRKLQSMGKVRRQGAGEIWGAVETLAYENEKLRSQSLGTSRNQFLHLLIKGKLQGREQFCEQVKELKMEGLSERYFYTVVWIVRPEMAARVTAEAVEKVLREEDSGQKLSGYLREEGEHGKFVFVGTSADQDQIRLTRKVIEVQEKLCQSLETDVMAAVSRMEEGFESVPQCYMDAMVAADYRFIRGYRCVIDSTMVVLNGEIGTAYPQKLFDKLNYQIKNGDADKIQQSLTEIIGYVKNSRLPLYYAKGLCYQLINNISAIIEQLNHELTQQKRTRLAYATVLADFETVDDLIEAVQNISLNICEFIRNEKNEEDSRMTGRIRRYLDSHIFDPNFAIQTMAAELGISLTSLSTFFKNQYGETLSDYVTRCRMQEAVRLLLEEERTIAEAVTEVGYLNVSSFIRKFKSIYGLTPGQYVKEHKGKDQNHDIFV